MAKIIISGVTLTGWTGLGSAPKVRLAADVPFQASTGEVHAAGNSLSNYVEIALVADGSDWTFPTTEVDSTTDSNIQSATYSAWIFNGTTNRGSLFERWAIPATTTPTTFAILDAYNMNRVPLRDNQSYSKTQTDLLIAQSLLVGNPATTTTLGRVKMSTAPADAASPIAVGDNDPRLVATINVKTYGASPDDATDDTAAIQAAIDAVPAYGEVVFPAPLTSAGYYKISSTLNITKPIILRGLGGVFPFDENNDPTLGAPYYNVSAARTTGVKFLWAGGASDMVKIFDTEGVTMDNLILDGAGLATYVLKLDTVRHSTFRQCAFVRPAAAGAALILGTSTLAVSGNNNNGSRFNNFFNCLFYGTNGVQIKKIGSGGSGGYHNFFFGCRIKFEGAAGVGLHLVNGDNNAFYSLVSRIYSGASTYGVRIGSSVTTPGGSTLDPHGAYDNYFYHLQCERLWVDADNPYAGVVFGLDMANMVSLPSIGANSKMTVTMNGYTSGVDPIKWMMSVPLSFTNLGFTPAIDALSGSATSSTGAMYGRTAIEYTNFIAGTTNVHTADETPGDVIFQNFNSAKRFSFYIGTSGATVPVFSMRSDLLYSVMPHHGLGGFVADNGKGVKFYKDGNAVAGTPPNVQYFIGHATDPAGVVDNDLHISSNERAGTWEDWIKLVSTGETHIQEAAKFDRNATANETRFLLYDITAGTFKRVSLGAADSGGAGFKLLRVAN